MLNSSDTTPPPAAGSLRSYFWTTGLAALAVLTAIAATNYLVDPYLIHQWNTELVHRPSPAQQKIMPWAKTYAAYQYRPEVVYLGSSRTEIGLPTDFPIFAGKRVFNLAISGASLGDAVNMLHHTSASHRPETVVWGLDYGWQFREKTGNTDFADGLVAKGPFYPIWRTLLNMKRSVSTAMTGETIKILFGISEQKCQSLLATYGQKSAQCLEYIMADEGGTAKAFEEVLKKREPQAGPADVPAAIRLLDRVTDDYCRQGTVFRLYLQPIHALAELSYWATQWDDLDNWKRSLVTVIDARRQQGCDIRLIDFSGFNRITTEEIPQATGRENMQHYWEQSHYRSEVGQLILKQLFARDRPEERQNFGVELTGETIERHLGDWRRKRGEYIDGHPRETGNMTL
ncbi:MAG: hypothetical protein ACD_75C02615G0004 [uncultured bacterium]|nr:MAG: hypothetical protein ACD_75C02615G0004 [uncultured bacterium]